MRQALPPEPALSKQRVFFYNNPMQLLEAVQLGAVQATPACSIVKNFCRLCTCSNCKAARLAARRASPKISRFFQAVSGHLQACSCLDQKFCRLCTCNTFPSLHLRNCTCNHFQSLHPSAPESFSTFYLLKICF